MSVEKFVGETYFEAHQLAIQKHGKDSFTIVTTKRIKKSIYLGLGQKEMVEITINTAPKQSPQSINAPKRPTDSVEISRFNTVVASYDDSLEDIVLSEPETKSPPKLNTTVPLHGFASYENTSKASISLRQTHELRSIQEGELPPQPNRLDTSEAYKNDQIALLNHMLSIKKEKNAEKKIDEKKNDEIGQLANRLDQLAEILNKMNMMTKNSVEDESNRLLPPMEALKNKLLKIEMPIEVVDLILNDLQEYIPEIDSKTSEEIWQLALNWIKRKLRFAPDFTFENLGKPKIMIFFGATGVGKTTTIAKLAASFKLGNREKRKVALFTLDIYRIGATEQLQHYSQIIDVDIEIVFEPENIQAAISRHQDKDLILIDTAGRCQKDLKEVIELKKVVDKLHNPLSYLVISATSKYIDMLETIRNFNQVGFEQIIITKVDETNTIGPVLGLLYKTGEKLAYVTHGQQVPDDFKKADFSFIDSRLPRKIEPKIEAKLEPKTEAKTEPKKITPKLQISQPIFQQLQK